MTEPDYITCTEHVVRHGDLQPCGRPAVAYRVADDNTPYPVCTSHVRHVMVPLVRKAAE